MVEVLERHPILPNVIFRVAPYLMNRAREFFVSFLQVKQDVIAVHTNTIRRGPLVARGVCDDDRDDVRRQLVWRAILHLNAGVAELADAQDLKSCDPKGSCGFDPRPRHLKTMTYGHAR
jgi:hypothetical protein